MISSDHHPSPLVTIGWARESSSSWFSFLEKPSDSTLQLPDAVTSVWHQSVSCLNFAASSAEMLAPSGTLLPPLLQVLAAGEPGVVKPRGTSEVLCLPSGAIFLRFVQLKDYPGLWSLQPFPLGGVHWPCQPPLVLPSAPSPFSLHAALWLHQASIKSSLRLKLPLFRKPSLLYCCCWFQLIILPFHSFANGCCFV